MTITVLATFHVKAEKTDTFLAACRELIEHTMHDQGVESYQLQRNSDNPNHFVFVERWASKADLDLHLNTAHIAKAFPILVECCETEPQVQIFTPAF